MLSSCVVAECSSPLCSCLSSNPDLRPGVPRRQTTYHPHPILNTHNPTHQQISRAINCTRLTSRPRRLLSRLDRRVWPRRARTATWPPPRRLRPYPMPSHRRAAHGESYHQVSHSLILLLVTVACLLPGREWDSFEAVQTPSRSPSRHGRRLLAPTRTRYGSVPPRSQLSATRASMLRGRDAGLPTPPSFHPAEGARRGEGERGRGRSEGHWYRGKASFNRDASNRPGAECSARDMSRRG